MPSLPEITDAVQEWARLVQPLEEAMDKLRDSIGLNPESPLITSIGRLRDQFTNRIGDAIGDTNDWLNWWQYETQFGKKPMEASAPGDPTPRIIRTPEDLAQIIHDCQ